MTTFWDLPNLNCTENLHQIYNQSGKLYKSMESGVNDMLLIKDTETSQFMGLQIVKEVTLCSHIVYSTNTPGIYVALNKSTSFEETWYFRLAFKSKKKYLVNFLFDVSFPIVY